jgi:probable rRNA maturation factor
VPVEIVRQGAGKQFPSRKLRTIAKKILELVQQDQAELSIALVGNGEIQRLNARFRRKNYATDVLSFPAETDLPGAVTLLGDVIISVEKAREQAKETQRTVEEEVITLLIHGIVHLLGYDHERSANEAKIMARLEKRIYRALCDEAMLQV